MKFWLIVLTGWLASCGVLTALVMFLFDAPFLLTLGSVAALVTALLWLWSRDAEAEPLSMRESLWNTPEDDEELDGHAR